MTDYDSRIDDFEEFKGRYLEVYSPCQAFHQQVAKKEVFDAEQAALIKLGVSIGTLHPGVIQSDVRKCLGLSISKDKIFGAVDMAVGTLSIPQLSDVYVCVRQAVDNSDESS